MKANTGRQNRKSAASSLFHPTHATVAETFWFVSSFVMSLIMGPFSALPALIAIFSLKVEGPMPMSSGQ